MQVIKYCVVYISCKTGFNHTALGSGRPTQAPGNVLQAQSVWDVFMDVCVNIHSNGLTAKSFK